MKCSKMKSNKVTRSLFLCQLVKIAGIVFFEVVFMSDLDSVYLIPCELFDPSKKASKYSEFKLGKDLLAYLV